MSFSLPIEDLENILERTEQYWKSYKNERFFVTGGTGFFGTWMLESFVYLNNKLGLNNTCHVLTRNAGAPQLFTDPSITYITGELDDFAFPEGEFSNIIHMATVKYESAGIQGYKDIAGTKRMLDFSLAANCSNFLYTSSGAIYGTQPVDVENIGEDAGNSPSLERISSSYGLSKRFSEFLCNSYSQEFGLNTKIARCFAFVGPKLPLDMNYAIGNFINDIVNDRDITIQGDGTPLRSYMYASDLAVWLWTLLFAGKTAYPYNVGSAEPISIAGLAKTVCSSLRSEKKVIVCKVAEPGRRPGRYVPDTNRASAELGLAIEVNIEDSIRKTFKWYKK